MLKNAENEVLGQMDSNPTPKKIISSVSFITKKKKPQ